MHSASTSRQLRQRLQQASSLYQARAMSVQHQGRGEVRTARILDHSPPWPSSEPKRSSPYRVMSCGDIGEEGWIDIPGKRHRTFPAQ